MLHELWEGQSGLRCAVAIDGKQKVRHFFHSSSQAVEEKAREWARHRWDVYFAPFVFDPATVRSLREQRRSGRSKDAASLSRAFWVDIDCGEGKPYATQLEGVRALGTWCKEQSVLPPTYIVSSGYGIHAYWLMAAPMTFEVWHPIATRLKRACLTAGLKIDPARTADAASILRMPGTMNYKNATAKACKLLREGPTYKLEEFEQALPMVGPRSLPSSGEKSKFDVQTDFRPSDANRVAERCAQMAHIKETGGKVEEPLWRAGLSVLSRCTDGDTLIHEWSKGDPRYDAQQTKEKADNTLGPATCRHFSDCAPDRCKGCPHFGKITSPIILGVAPEEPEIPQNDAGGATSSRDVYLNRVGAFLVTNNGVLLRAEADGEDKVLSCVPVWVTQVRERVSNDGDQDSSLQLVWRSLDGRYRRGYLLQADLHDSKAFTKWLARHNLISQIFGVAGMVKFISQTTRELIKSNNTQYYYDSLGWHENNSKFVIGQMTVTEDGLEESQVQTSNPISRIGGTGTLEGWREPTEALGQPGLELHAFTVLCGFASPLLHLCGVNSAVVSLAGESGFGKTLLANYALSIYGSPEYLHQSASATPNAVERQLASNQHIPYLLDEVSGLKPYRLAEFLYIAANGRAKDTLTRGRESRFAGSWQLVPFVTTNRPIGEFEAKDIQEAHRRRLLELHFKSRIDSVLAAGVVQAMRENYGAAAPVYMDGVLRLREQIPALFERTVKQIQQAYGFSSVDRFVLWTLAAAKVAGAIAERTGCIGFKSAPVVEHVAKHAAAIQNGVTRDEDRLNAVLANFLVDRKKDVSVWDGVNMTQSVVDHPVARYDPAQDVVIIGAKAFKQLLLAEGVALSNVKDRMDQSGVIQQSKKLYPSTPNIWCYIFPCEAFDLDIKEGGARGTP